MRLQGLKKAETRWFVVTRTRVHGRENRRRSDAWGLASPLQFVTGLTHLVGLLADGQSTGYFSSASAVHHAVVTDEVPDDTQSIVKGSFGFLDDLGKTILPKLT